MARQEVDVLQGTLDMLVLKALTWGRMHGYSILAWLRQATDGELRIEDAALYPGPPPYAPAQNAHPGTHARVFDPRLASTSHGWRAPDRGCRAVPRAPPHGGTRAHRGGVGALGKQPEGEVLSADGSRAPRAARRVGELDAIRIGDRQ